MREEVINHLPGRYVGPGPQPHMGQGVEIEITG